ncbi:hypothetical protein D3C81_1488810 [compost metagenome]
MGSFNGNTIGPWTAFFGYLNLAFATEVLTRKALCIFQNLLICTREDHFAAIDPGFRSDIDQVISRLHHLLLMLDHHHCITNIAQRFQHRDQALCITWMKSNTWLVQHINRTYE